jgi:hypothetical protein
VELVDASEGAVLSESERRLTQLLGPLQIVILLPAPVQDAEFRMNV